MAHPCTKCPTIFDNEKSLVGHISAAPKKRKQKQHLFCEPKAKKSKPPAPATTRKSKSTTSTSLSTSTTTPERTIQHELELEHEVNEMIPLETTSLERFLNHEMVPQVTTQMNMRESSTQQVGMTRTERQIERFDQNTGVLIERITQHQAKAASNKTMHLKKNENIPKGFHISQISKLQRGENLFKKNLFRGSSTIRAHFNVV